MQTNHTPDDDYDYVTEALTVDDIRDCIGLRHELITEDEYIAWHRDE